jgi:hypothetical protein
MKKRRMDMSKEKEMEQILHKVCKEMMEQEDAQIEAEMKCAEPHLFSDIFERKMKKLLDSMDRKKK